jgi:hypothetical protein
MATKRRIRRIPKSRRANLTRTEFDRVIDMLNTRGEILKECADGLGRLRQDFEVQFKRIAQLQAEMDRLKRDR